MATIKTHFKKVMDQDPGAQYYKVDLHIHTASSNDARGSKKYGYSQEAGRADKESGYKKARQIANEMLDKLVHEKISVAAFTDHNSPSLIDNLDLSGLTWYELVKEEYARRRDEDKNHPAILLLPGVEITSDRIHILGIFDNNDPHIIFKISSLVRSVDIREDEFGRVQGVFGTKTIWEVASAIDDMGGICIPAHVNRSNMRSLLGQYQPPDMEIERLVQHRAIHVFGVVPPSSKFSDKRTYQSLMENKTFEQGRGEKRKKVGYHDWMVKKRKEVPQHLPALGYMMNSDAHEVEKIGHRFSWVKMDDLSFRSLAAALRNPYYQIAPNHVQPAANVCSQVLGLSVEGGFAAGLSLRFNQNFNCVIGRPSSGKTTLMRAFNDTVKARRLGLRIRNQQRATVNSIADDLWKELLGGKAFTKGETLRKDLPGEMQQQMLDRFLETQDVPWQMFVFFSEEQPDGRKRIYAAERVRNDSALISKRKEDTFSYYVSDPQPWPITQIDNIQFSEIDVQDFRRQVSRPNFYFGDISLGDPTGDYAGARSMLDQHILPDMEGFSETRGKLFGMLNDIEDLANAGQAESDAAAEKVSTVFNMLEERFAIREKFAVQFNKTESEHALRIRFAKGSWNTFDKNPSTAEAQSDFVHSVRLYLHNRENYDLFEPTFYRPARRGRPPQQVDYADLTIGQRNLMAFRLLLNSTADMAPVIIDNPENWLDNETLLEFTDMRRDRDDQLILFTQNPNIAVLGNAEQIFVLDNVDGRTVKTTCGGLEDAGTAVAIIDILEGGDTAFQRKLLRYQSVLRQMGLKIELQRP